MKRIFFIFGTIFVTIAVGLVFFFEIGRATGCLDNLKVTGIGLYKDQRQFIAKFNTDTQMSEINQKMNEWWSQADHGWKPTFVTYMPGFTISTDKGGLNILGHSGIINCPAGQFARDLSASEFDFFEKLKTDIPQWSSD